MHKMMHEKLNYGRSAPGSVRAEGVLLTLNLKNRVHTNTCIIRHAATVCM